MTRRLTIFASLLVIPLLRSFLPLQIGEAFTSLPFYLEWFITGFLLADLYLVDWRESPSRSFVWDLASLVSWPSLVGLLFWNFLPIILAPLVLTAYIGAFRGKMSGWLFSRPFFTVIGGMCYSIYLLHYAVISGIERLTLKYVAGSYFIIRFAMDACIVIPAIMAVTIVFFVFLERPCMDPGWPARITGRVFQWIYRPETIDGYLAPGESVPLQTD